MTKELSLAAQAVLNAYRDADIDDRVTAAAVLRVISEMVRMDQPLGDTDADAGVFGRTSSSTDTSHASLMSLKISS